MTPSELQKLDGILDRQIAAITARKRAVSGNRRGDVFSKTMLARREPTKAEHLARAHRAVPVRYEDGCDGAREIAADERWYHANVSMRGKHRGVFDHGIAKAGSDKAIDIVVDRILDVAIPVKVRGELIDAIADEYFLGNAQKVLDWALSEREARDRRQNGFGKGGEPAVGVDRFGNQTPVTSGRAVEYGVPIGTHIADRMHPMAGSGTGQNARAPDFVHLDEIKRGKRPFAPLWAGVG
jgi:hypothetical protein